MRDSGKESKNKLKAKERKQNEIGKVKNVGHKLNI